MLKKLMKHELRATSRTMLPMLLFVLAAAVGGNLSVYRLLNLDSRVFSAIGGFLIVVYAASIMASCIVSFVLMIQRFYRSLLQDEGYLMMTLPVSVHAHIFSKLLVSLFWWFAVAAAGLLSLAILVFRIDLAREFLTLLSNLRLGDLPLQASPLHIFFYLLELLLMLTAYFAYICLMLYAAMAVGHSFTHRKGLMTVAAFFALGMANSLLGYSAMFLINLTGFHGFSLWFSGLPYSVQLHLMPLVITGTTLVPCAAFYALTAYCLKNRLNLA